MGCLPCCLTQERGLTPTSFSSRPFTACRGSSHCVTAVCIIIPGAQAHEIHFRGCSYSHHRGLLLTVSLSGRHRFPDILTLSVIKNPTLPCMSGLETSDQRYDVVWGLTRRASQLTSDRSGAAGRRRTGVRVAWVPGAPVVPRSPFRPGLPGRSIVSPMSPARCKRRRPRSGLLRPLLHLLWCCSLLTNGLLLND